VYQSLVTVNETQEFGTGSIQYLPGLAANWTVSSDGTTYTFNMRQGVTFSSGNPLNAYQVWGEMYGFYYLTGNASSWLKGYNLFDMSKVDFGPSTIALMNSSGLITPTSQLLSIMQNSSWPIYVTSANQIVFRLISPFIYFPGVMLVYQGLIFDTQWLLQHGGFGTPTAFNSNFNENPIPGTGPYVVSKVAEDDYVEFTQNPTYWGNSLSPAQISQQPLFDPGHAKNVIIYYKPDDLARYTDLSTGAVQISAVLISNFNLVQANPTKYSYFTLPSWAGLTSALGLNTQLYPTNITDVRLAIVHALNYTDIRSKAFLGQMNPYVGPEYPAWKDYYDLGNYSQYSYNVTLAQQYLKNANISTLPTFSMNIVADCQFCSNFAQTVQSDLAQIGITVTITVQDASLFYTPYGSYSYELGNAGQIGNLVEFFGTWASGALTPAADWVDFVSNQSQSGNTAIYYNPTVQAAVDAFTSTTNVSLIQSLVREAQTQIYNDAPYAWIGVSRLWYSDGSLVWQKNIIKSFLVDPTWSSQTTAPIFNTVTFVS